MMSAERRRLIRQLNQALIEGGGLCTIDDLIDLARDKRVQIWDRAESLVVTELLQYPQRTLLHVIVAAGGLDDVLELENDVEEFARSEGATLMVAHGRPAWARIGRRKGWQAQAMRYYRSLAPRNGSGS